MTKVVGGILKNCCFEFVLSNDIITLRFSLKQMTLGTTTFHSSVRYIRSTNGSRSENSYYQKPNTVSSRRKQNKNFSQDSKKFIKDYLRAEDFKLIK